MSYPSEWRLALRNGDSNALRPGGLPAAPARIGSRHTDCLVSGEIAGPESWDEAAAWRVTLEAALASQAALEGTRARLHEVSSITA
jgi:hypothetical protein